MLAALQEVENSYPRTLSCYEDLIKFSEDTVARGKTTLSELEREIAEKGREMMRVLLEETLEKLPNAEGVKGIEGEDGVIRLEARTRLRRISTNFGVISYERKGFSARESSSIMPKDIDLNIPENQHSFALQLLVSEEAAKGSFSEVQESVCKHTGVEIGKQQVQQIVIRAAQDFDEFYKSRRSVKNVPRGELVVLTTDGKGVVMRKEDLRASTQRSLEESSQKLTKRLSKGEKANRKRMATVASVYSIEPFIRTPEDIVSEFRSVSLVKERPKPNAKRVWASIEKGQSSVIENACKEVLRRDRLRNRKLVVLIDGQRSQLLNIEEALREHRLSGTIIIDIIHVIEYIWKAARCFYPESSPKCEQWVNAQLLNILSSKSETVVRSINRKAEHAKLDSDKLAVIKTTVGYLCQYKQYIDYKSYLENGYPIATGVIEGACRHLVKDRMDITGARWTLKTAEAVLKLRSLKASKDFDEYWGFYELQEHERNHQGKVKSRIPMKPILTLLK